MKLFTDADYPADPYPGFRPDHSFVHFDGAGHSLDTAPDGWRDRRAVLAYGSNACPSKITWLRDELGLEGPVVVVRARCVGLAAVWASGLRVRDGQRPTTLVAMPGVVEWHAVWFATPEQIEVLDVCEARGSRHHLSLLHTGTITLEDGPDLDNVCAYVGATDIRFPLLVDGVPVRVAEVPQCEAVGLEGSPGTSHGIEITLL